MKTLKKITLLSVNLLFLMISNQAHSQQSVLEIMSQIMEQQLINPITWRVGDASEFNVSAGMFGNGKMTKKVTEDIGTAIWVVQEMNIPSHQEKIEKLYNKADGQVLKVIRNGTEQNPADSNIEVISQENVLIQVPAGAFDTVHIIGKNPKTSKIELWYNPQATVIDGTIKLIMKSSFYTITSELVTFRRAP
jgi:hypothetical protein